MPTLTPDFTEVSLSHRDILERDVMERSFYDFILGAWHVLEPATPYSDNWHMVCLAEHLQAITNGQLRKLIINVPPGSSKSLTTAVFWPVWHWLHHPADRFLTASYKDELSGRDSLKSRRLIQSAWFQERWQDKFSLAGDQSAKMHYENNYTGYRLATHVGSGTGHRAKIRILDDPHDIEEAESDVVREGTVEWVRSTWAERESSAKDSVDIVIMQRVHARDVCGYLLELGGFYHLMLPMEYDPKRRFCGGLPGLTYQEDPRTEPLEILDQQRWSREDVDLKKKRLGPYKASGQLQQSPSPQEGGIYKKHWWRFWHYPGKPLPAVKVEMADGSYVDCPCVPLPNGWDKELQSWDMAFKETNDSDYVVGQHWAKHAVNSYLMRQTRGRLDFVKSAEAVETMSKQFVIGGPILVEDKANGPAVIAALRSKVPGLIGVNPEGGKESRAHAYSWVVEAGHIYLPHPSIAPWVEGFIEELRTFPNGEHDDIVDCFTQAMHRLYGSTNMGLPITPEYHARFFVSQEDLNPIPGIEAFRFWYMPETKDGTPWPTCIIGQVMPAGQIRILDCVQIENESMDALIDRRVLPVLQNGYRGVWKWRDVGNFREGKPMDSQATLQKVLSEKLKVGVEPGEPDFEVRVNAIKTILGQTNRLVINRRVSQGERELLVHECLNGNFAYEADKSGHMTGLRPQKGNKYTAIGDCLGHGLARIFVRKPQPQRTIKEKQAQHRQQQQVAKGYSVKS